MGRLALGLAAVLTAGCANAGDKPAATDAAHDSPGPPGDGSGSSAGPQACPAGQLATNVATDGTLTCSPPTSAIADTVATSCATYFGWRDSCDGCTTPPAKYGSSGETCSVGVGLDNTCTVPNLGGKTVTLFGLNMDGNVDGNDAFYGSLHCAQRTTASSAAPCPAGQMISGHAGSGWTCAPIATAVVDYIRASCSLYLGWQDGCAGCTTLPTKWGHAGDGGCQNGVGLDDTCTTTVIGGETVNLFGLNMDGDVDDNDKLHVGLDCAAAAPATTPSSTACPAGQFLTATATDGSFTCTSPAPLVHDYVAQHCSIYLGWRDGCDGCTLVPAKWGSAKVGACALGTGTNDTCSTFTLGAASVAMFGLATDGDVDQNDTFYMTLHCD